MSHWATGLTGLKEKTIAYDEIFAILYKAKKDPISPFLILSEIENVIGKTQQELYPTKKVKK